MTDANKETIRKAFHYAVFPKLVWGKSLNDSDRKVFTEWKEAFKPNLEIFSYFKDKRVLFQIVKTLKNNELCIDNSIRHLYSSKVEYLLKIFYFYKILEEPKTFYRGLAGFSHREAPPFAIQEKKEWQNNVWTGGENKFFKSVNSFDFAIDLDSEKFTDSLDDARKLFKFFNKFKISFAVHCSGKKGFHFLIDFEEFKDLIQPFDLDFTVAFCKSVMLDLVKYLKLKKVDALIYSSTRFIKCDFAIDKRNNRVIYPLSDEEFNTFENNYDKYMSIDYVLSQKDLGFIDIFRGRNSNPKGFQQMIKFLGDKI